MDEVTRTSVVSNRRDSYVLPSLFESPISPSRYLLQLYEHGSLAPLSFFSSPTSKPFVRLARCESRKLLRQWCYESILHFDITDAARTGGKVVRERREAERRYRAPHAFARLSVIGNKFRNKLPVTRPTHRGKATGPEEGEGKKESRGREERERG